MNENECKKFGEGFERVGQWSSKPPYLDGDIVNFEGNIMICNMRRKLMLCWGHNVFGYYHLSLWAMNDEGVGCYEYAVETGISKIAALWNLAKRLWRQGQFKLLFHIDKVENNLYLKGPVKHFKIERVSENLLLIRQRHTILLFFHFWDQGAEVLCPNYRAESSHEAYETIYREAKEQGFAYRIRP